jgi:LysM repeat protein
MSREFSGETTVQAFKTLLIVAVLSAVAYGVYVGLTGVRDVEPPPGATPDDWQGAPQIELPSADASQGGAPPTLAAPAAPRAPQVLQSQPAAPADAPPFDAPSAPQQDSGAVPPFVAPSVGPGDPNAIPSASLPIVGQDPMQAPEHHDPAAAGASYQQPAAADPGVASPFSVPPTEPAASLGSGVPESNFATDYAAAGALLQENRLDPALLLLSRWYDDPRLTEPDQQVLLPLLHQLAGTVIYSREHLLLPAYEVQPGDTLDRVAMHYKVPAQLLAKINGIADPNQLRPGDKLKVVQGPFDAVVSMNSRHLSLMLGGRFAGRFPVGIGADQTTPEGDFTVKIKQPNPTYYGPDRVIDANDPTNPLGKYWIGLDDHLGIHGTNDPASIGQADSRGCIRLSQRDIEDVYDMMTVESRVRIVR